MTDYYQLPENSPDSIRKMGYILATFFAVVTLVAVLIVIYADKIATRIPFSAEQKFVKPYESLIGRWYDQESDPEIEEYLQKLADKLASAMYLSEDYDIKIHYVDSDVENAFATLGGHIIIFKGLIDLMSDENSLSMVLAHELAHIKHRDPIAAMGRGFALQMIYGFLTSDYSSAADLASLSSSAGMSFFSREQEKAADLAALDALNNHYGHVSGFDVFFKKILENHEKEGMAKENELDWLSSHPNLQARIDYLTDKVKEKKYTEGSASSLPKELQKEEHSTTGVPDH